MKIAERLNKSKWLGLLAGIHPLFIGFLATPYEYEN